MTISFKNDLLLAITTTARPGDQEQQKAQTLAEQTGYPYLPRQNRSLAKQAALSALDGLLVVERKTLALWLAGEVFRYHPNMAKLRLLALLSGKNDSLTSAMELTPGESVLDCTCGLGADAILAAHMVGENGRVCALEASAPLALLVGEGMASYTLAHPEELTRAMRRIEVRQIDFAHVLRQAEESTWDVVYFDPMFNETIDAASGLDLVRRLGHSGTPSPADLDQARRVARRRVVMKDRQPGPNLMRLGFAKVQEGRRICYGTLKAL